MCAAPKASRGAKRKAVAEDSKPLTSRPKRGYGSTIAPLSPLGSFCTVYVDCMMSFMFMKSSV